MQLAMLEMTQLCVSGDLRPDTCCIDRPLPVHTSKGVGSRFDCAGVWDSEAIVVVNHSRDARFYNDERLWCLHRGSWLV